MKAPLGNFFSFSRQERRGLVALLCLIVAGIVLWQAIPYFVHPDVPAGEAQFVKAWQDWTKQQESGKETAHHDISNVAAGQLFDFDPNEIDSNGLQQLGLSVKTTHMLLNWRRKGKVFYQKEDLRTLYTLSTQDYERLAPYIRILQTRPAYQYTDYRAAHEQPLPPLPDKINLNLCDSALLVRLKGIGPTLAHKLIERRNALGGFLDYTQLLEVYKFPDSTFEYLKLHLELRPADIRKLNLNTVTEEELSRHPYIGAQMAQHIVMLRGGLSKYEKTAQLRQVPLMNEEKYRKIAPYCTTE
jgi:DNA uptake protein ComE-like DNA-binding protein